MSRRSTATNRWHQRRTRKRLTRACTASLIASWSLNTKEAYAENRRPEPCAIRVLGAPVAAEPWRYVSDFVQAPQALFDVVANDVSWTRQMKSRHTASMGIPYNYAGASYPEAAWLPAVWEVATKVERCFGFRPTNCLLNAYPTGAHSIGWHADDVSILAPDTGIVIVSLGAVRTLSLRTGPPEAFHYTQLHLQSGSALYMSQQLQGTHKHRIRRQPGAGARISLTFRHLTHAPAPVTRPAWSSTFPSRTAASASPSAPDEPSP